MKMVVVVVAAVVVVGVVGVAVVEMPSNSAVRKGPVW